MQRIQIRLKNKFEALTSSDWYGIREIALRRERMGGYIVSPSTMNSMLTTTRKVNLTTASSSSVSVSVWILGTLEADTGKQFNINHHNTLFFACVPSFFKAASCLSALSETLKSRKPPLTADTVDCLGKAGRVCNCSRNDCGRTTGECLTALACTASRLMAIFFMTVPPLTFCIAPYQFSFLRQFFET